MPDKKDYFDRINHVYIIYTFINLSLFKFSIFNRIKLFLKTSKIFMLLTLKYI